MNNYDDLVRLAFMFVLLLTMLILVLTLAVGVGFGIWQLGKWIKNEALNRQLPSQPQLPPTSKSAEIQMSVDELREFVKQIDKQQTVPMQTNDPNDKGYL